MYKDRRKEKVPQSKKKKFSFQKNMYHNLVIANNNCNNKGKSYSSWVEYALPHEICETTSEHLLSVV